MECSWTVASIPQTFKSNQLSDLIKYDLFLLRAHCLNRTFNCENDSGPSQLPVSQCLLHIPQVPTRSSANVRTF